MKKYDTIVYIGRFQPVHTAHLEIIKQAASLASEVIIIVGSINQPSTFKNPWSFEERRKMLIRALPEELSRSSLITICGNYDTIYNDQAWVSRIQEIVSSNSTVPNGKVAIIGHDKDESTFYLNMFPQWERIEVDNVDEPLNATDIRNIYFSHNYNPKYLKCVLPDSVFEYLEFYRSSVNLLVNKYTQLIREREFIEEYKKQFASLPYPPIFVTTDAVVIQSGHVLMIKRRSEPGRGLWALPGGFLNAHTDKSIQDGMIRELREETGIKVPAPVLVGSIKKTKVFDAINRSARGRTITHAFYIQLLDGQLPKVKGMDDAEKAKWIPIGELKSHQCFEDHYEIIQDLVGF